MASLIIPNELNILNWWTSSAWRTEWGEVLVFPLVLLRSTLPSNRLIEQCRETCPALLEFVGLVSAWPPLDATRAKKECAQEFSASPDLDLK